MLLAAVSGCTTVGIEPCDVLVDIPQASAEVNQILVTKARPTAVGIAKNQGRVKKYNCGGLNAKHD